MVQAVTRYAECESSVFISYAHPDNQVYGNWIEDFASELKRDLAAEVSRLRSSRATLPPVHLSHLNGPVHGELDQQLRQRVQRSFAMVIVVGRHYVTSDWCLKELRYFHELFGDEGMNSRLYIVALADEPIHNVTKLSDWQHCMRGRSQVWQSYFDDGLESHRPVPVLRDDGRAPTQAFTRRFDLLRNQLVASIKADIAKPQPAVNATRLLVGAGVPELTPAIARFAQAARAHEPTTAVLEATVLRRRDGLDERLRDAERLLLPYNGAQPLYPVPDGGHLAMQLQTWRRLGKTDDQVYLLDLSEVPTDDPAEPEHTRWLVGLPLKKLRPAELLLELFPPPLQPVQLSAGAAPAASRKVKLFIESNRHEPSQWKPLGEQIGRRWQQLLKERGVSVPLEMRSTGMNIDKLTLFNLNDADGLVLLWGQKEEQSLVSQINLVEDQVSERAPGIVAYLSPPQPRSAGAQPAMGWQVLRFSGGTPPTDLVPDDDDEPELTRFLTEMLDRTSRRHKLGPL